jgi:hypothetical protein
MSLKKLGGARLRSGEQRPESAQQVLFRPPFSAELEVGGTGSRSAACFDVMLRLNRQRLSTLLAEGIRARSEALPESARELTAALVSCKRRNRFYRPCGARKQMRGMAKPHLPRERDWWRTNGKCKVPRERRATHTGNARKVLHTHAVRRAAQYLLQCAAEPPIGPDGRVPDTTTLRKALPVVVIWLGQVRLRYDGRKPLGCAPARASQHTVPGISAALLCRETMKIRYSDSSIFLLPRYTCIFP